MKATIDTSCEKDEILNEEKLINEVEYFKDPKDKPFITVHKWEGKIDRLEGNIIFATMFSLMDNEWDEMEFPIEDLDKDDLMLVKIGALFNFYIGYATSNSSRKKAKLIKFRRINAVANWDNILDRFNSLKLEQIVKKY